MSFLNFLQKTFSKLVNSYTIGFAITALFVFEAFIYYGADFDRREHHDSQFVRLMHRFHQASIDWKLRVRGPRPGSDEVVILGVDEKSLVQEGQWPWPRKKVADLVDRLIEGGAKVIGFDVIWSEEEQNNSVLALQKLKEDVTRGAGGENSVTPLIDKHITAARSDLAFGETIGKHGEQLVMGAYFDDPVLPGFIRMDRGFRNLCLEQIYQTGRNYSKWDQLEPLVVAQDESIAGHPEELPEFYLGILHNRFAELEEQVQKDLVGKVGDGEKLRSLSKTAQIEVAFKVEAAKWRYCQRWLNSPTDKKPDEDWEAYKGAWPAVVADGYDESLDGLDFEEGIERFKNWHYNSHVKVIGKWNMNVDSIHQSALYTGYFNAKLDSDGVVRRSFLMVRSGQSYFPSLAFATYLVAKKLRAMAIVNYDSSGINAGSKYISELHLFDEEGELAEKIPVNGNGYLTINYAGPEKMFAYVSAADVLNDEESLTITKYVKNSKTGRYEQAEIVHKKEDFYKDKIFLMGATAIGLHDLRVTPFAENNAGVETHANVLDNLIRKDFLKTHAKEELYMLGFMLLMGLVFTIILSRFGVVQSLFFMVLVFLGLVLGDWTLLFSKGWMVSIVFPVSLLLILFGGLVVYKYFTEEKNKKQLKGTFGKYVSPAIVEEILADPSNIELGGRKENVTVFFSDVRGFTTISETLSPTDLGDLLNEYLTPMTEIIFENGGTLDKYIGDAIMAFFGAPLQNERHPHQACKAALGNIKKLFELQKVLEERNLPHIDVGIGLNTGDVSVGNMGSNIVRNYTIMGDSVNLGARLEGITKQYGVRIIISEYTEKEIRGEFLTREVDCVKVKGKNLPVRIYELMSEKNEDETLEKIAATFDRGYKCYHAKEFEQGIRHFNEVLEIRDDFCSKLYIQRCEDYIKSPPPADWDGVFTMTTK